MSRLSDIQSSSSGSAAQIAQSVQAFRSFRSLCDRLTVRAYQELLKRKVHSPDWSEDTFTANFQPIMEELCVKDGKPIHVQYQTPQLTPPILAGATLPKTAKVMDLVFSVFARPAYLRYGIEAKILTSVNTHTRNARYLCKEYIVSGMDRFINGSYQMGGCMVGYVVAGNTNDALDLINANLSTSGRASEILKDQHVIERHLSCYQSQHSSCTLKHFLFLFV